MQYLLDDLSAFLSLVNGESPFHNGCHRQPNYNGTSHIPRVYLRLLKVISFYSDTKISFQCKFFLCLSFDVVLFCCCLFLLWILFLCRMKVNYLDAQCKRSNNYIFCIAPKSRIDKQGVSSEKRARHLLFGRSYIVWILVASKFL